MSPAISLILCAYNRAEYVAAAIQSVRRQSLGDFELVVWDDGSTDNTLEAARGAAGDDPRVRIVGDFNRGHPAALNAAARLVSAPYFGWLDSDDLLHDDALKETAAILDANAEIGVVYTDYFTMDETGNVRGLGKRCSIPFSKDRLLVDFMSFQFRLMRRPLFDEVGGLDPEMVFAEDYDLCLKLSEITQFYHLAKPLYYYRIHRRSISASQRLKQILATERASRAALARRKLDDKYELEVEHRAKFFLRLKRPDEKTATD